MVEKQSKTSAPTKNPKDKTADSSPGPVAVDRPGFDLGGSSGETSAGTGLGLGTDAAENRRDRKLPGRKGKQT